MQDMKQRLAKLSASERREMAAYRQRLRDESPAGRREMSRVMKEMDQGQKTRLTDLAKQLGPAR